MDNKNKKHRQHKPRNDCRRQSPEARGHDALLYSSRANKGAITVVDVNKDQFTGVLLNYDAFTLTLKLQGHKFPMTFFKGSLLRFSISE